VDAPLFGANYWAGIVQPVTGGGIPAQHPYIEIKMVFKDGGAFDFDSSFKRVRDELRQAIDVARESGRIIGREHAVDYSAVHLDQLPAYQEVGGGLSVQPLAPQRFASSSASQAPQVVRERSQERFEPPREPPPGYEEAQQDGVANSLEESERRLS
jgi:WW domain-binding protein 2